MDLHGFPWISMVSRLRVRVRMRMRMLAGHDAERNLCATSAQPKGPAVAPIYTLTRIMDDSITRIIEYIRITRILEYIRFTRLFE